MQDTRVLLREELDSTCRTRLFATFDNYEPGQMHYNWLNLWMSTTTNASYWPLPSGRATEERVVLRYFERVTIRDGAANFLS